MPNVKTNVIKMSVGIAAIGRAPIFLAFSFQDSHLLCALERGDQSGVVACDCEGVDDVDVRVAVHVRHLAVERVGVQSRVVSSELERVHDVYRAVPVDIA